MKSKTRQIIVISTMIMRKAHYVCTSRKRLDGQYQVELTANLRDAKEFDSQQEAQQICDKIFNPYHRDFGVEETLVEWTASKRDIVPGDMK